MTTHSLPTPYQDFIFKSRYARWLESEKRREDFPETVDRYLSFISKHLRSKHNHTISNVMTVALREHMTSLKNMPSMRALMTAGEALARDNTAGFNPVAGDTIVVTRDGNYPISELSGQSMDVLNKDGRWAEATFRSYGIQDTTEVVLQASTKTSRSVVATANHRWYLESGKVVPTSKLKLGDIIPYMAAPRPELDSDYQLGVTHGIIYGDGTTVRARERVKGFMVRLCGDGAELLPFLQDYPLSYPASCNGDPVVYCYDDFAATVDLKALPVDETESYRLGFIRGVIATDGSVGAVNSQVTVSGTSELMGWMQKNAPSVGIYTMGVQEFGDETNLGKRTKRCLRVTLDRASLIKDDFLHPRKKENFKPITRKFKVQALNKVHPCEVYCAEVPDTNTFTLDGGIVTGNCAFVAVDDIRAFDETMFILLNGTGVGFSVEGQFINLLPKVPDELIEVDEEIVVGDSKEGWALSYQHFVRELYNGRVLRRNTSLVRPKGARLKTFGGRASGPEPLADLFKFTLVMFTRARGRQLRSLECHDIQCKIGDIVVVGGVRRSAMISLSDASDLAMAKAKSFFPVTHWYQLDSWGYHYQVTITNPYGEDEICTVKFKTDQDEYDINMMKTEFKIGWYHTHPHRRLSNNSAVFESKPDAESFLKEWHSMVESKSGERGIFSRAAATKQVQKNGRRDANHKFGTNPCAEIILRSCQMCNLSTNVIRAEDTLEEILQKITVATTMGTYQSTLTHFPYLRDIWRKNTEEERLLGVSLTGVMDHPVLNGSMGKRKKWAWLQRMQEQATAVNKVLAKELGIPQSTAITCIKPEGTVSQLTDSASGMHSRHAEYYLRTVRQDSKDPMTDFMIAMGFPHEPCNSKPETTTIFSFPMRSPKGAITRNDMTALEQLDNWLDYQRHYCDHKPSCTISVRDEEWIEVAAWVYKNFDEVSGISFLPHWDHIYAQAPYQDIDAATYFELEAKMPVGIDWSRLADFEKEDSTVATQTLACTAGGCEI